MAEDDIDRSLEATAGRHGIGILRAFERYLVQRYGLQRVPAKTPLERAEAITQSFNRHRQEAPAPSVLGK